MSSKSFTRSFAGGELAPQLFGRLDLTKFQTGLQKCLNFMVTPQGPVENRAGFEYVIKARSSGAVLIPFTYNSEQSFALEFGNGYIRFHTNGGTLLRSNQVISNITQAAAGVVTYSGTDPDEGDWVFLSSIGGMPELSNRYAVATNVNTAANTFELYDLFGYPIDTTELGPYTSGGRMARVYEIGSPYDSADVLDLHYVQSADVLTITHQDYATRELRRLAATSWSLTEVSFSPTISTPGTPTASAGGPGGGTAEDHTYVVTALAADTLEESLASASATASTDLTVSGNYVEIQPPAVAAAIRYNVYKYQSGIYGYIGQTDGAAFRDSNITPDMSKTPPLSANPFAVGAISEVSVTAGGAGYGSTSQTGGEITAVNVTAGGTGYTTASASASGGGSGATFTVNLVMGAVVSVTVDNGGSLYSSPTITITGDGTGATATATADPIVEHDVALSVSGGGGSGAILEPVVVGGAITGVRVVARGSGYSAPVVTVTEAAGGAGATFSASVTGSDVHPQAVSYFEQRRCFGGTVGAPQNVWMTRSGTERNMTYSIPTQDDDSIAARIVAREANVVRHLVPLNDLLAFTSGGVWRLASASGDALTPANLSAKPQSYVGASMVQPVVTSSSVLYAPDRGSHIRELSYKWESQSYQADDVSVLAPHLFDYKGVIQIAYSKTPHQILWAVRDDGVLLGLTYQPEHEVKAWHQHDTQGLFKSVCAVPEGDEDGIYVVVQRTVNGQAVQYIERMHTRQFAALEDAFFVDSGATYDGSATDTITGLWHLEGMEVVALADGGVEPAQTVENGSIALSAEASVVHVGLAYNSDAQTMPLSLETAAAFGQGTLKNVNEVALRVYQSSGIKAGPSFTKLREYPQRTVDDNYGAPPGMVTGIVQFKLDPTWQRDGTVCVRQPNPLPLTLLAMSVEVSSGG